jgi:hypothetical protein
MERLGSEFFHSCGHPVLPLTDEGEDEYAPRSGFFCARCMQAAQKNVNTSIFVNLQQIAPGMVAFVLEISESGAEFAEFLAALGFAFRQASNSESAEGLGLQPVWRKEFWFDVYTQPEHVILLLERVKQEAYLLADYLPNGLAAVHFADFPEDFAKVDPL